jgi:DNA-binding SARP family transcriptional activator
MSLRMMALLSLLAAIVEQPGSRPVSREYGPGVLQFRILGPLEVVDDRGPIRLGGPKQRATLAILLLNANRVVSVDRLADDLYAGAAPVTALKQVQRQISELRKTLGSVSSIETRSPGYVLRLSSEQLDLSVFERLAAEASEALSGGDEGRAAVLLRQALELWRGAPLADLTYESFARPAIERLEEIRLAAVAQRIEADLALGRHAGVVAELEQLVSEHPLREQFRVQLMLALYRSGRQGEALEVFRRTRETLVRDLGIEPARALQQLERRILAQDPELDAPSAGPRRPVVELHGTVLVVATDEATLATSMSAIEPLASQRELILAQLLANDADVGRATAALNARSAALGGNARAAAFTSADPAADVLRLATGYDVELVLVPAPNGSRTCRCRTISCSCSKARRRMSASQWGIRPIGPGATASTSPSAGPRTTGRRSRSALGSRVQLRRRFVSSVHAPIPRVAGATLAGCSRTRRSLCKGLSA